VYDDWVVPRVLNLALGTKVVGEERGKALAGVKGRVLEVGFGSGHNLPHYPPGVERVVGVDPSGESARLARRRIARAPFPVELVPLAGEQLDAADGSFDSVVCTFTLCTIGDPLAALGQMRRVLAPGGCLFFVEHGRSDEPRVQRWQDRLNGAQRWLFGGCNLNRPMDQLITEAGFELVSLERYYAPGPRPWGYLYRGVARPKVTGSSA
jgi:ubiquinone/menaquinone biosynthesis C-methylase UbiE